MNTPNFLIQPNDWVKEELLTHLTGMTSGEIKNYRQFRWIEGIHFKRASSMKGDKGKHFKYNRIAIDKFSTSEKVA